MRNRSSGNTCDCQAGVKNKTKPSKRPASARNRRNIRRAAARAGRVGRDARKGGEREVSSPLSLRLFSLSGQGWVTHVPPASTPFVGTRTPTRQILIRSLEERTRRNACRIRLSLADAFLQTLVLGLPPSAPLPIPTPRDEFPSRPIAYLLSGWNPAKSFEEHSFFGIKKRFLSIEVATAEVNSYVVIRICLNI